MEKRLMPIAKKLCDTIMKDFGEILSKKWQYDAGLCLKGFEAVYKECGDERYNDYIKAEFNYFINDDGTINTYNPEVRNIDHINNGKNLFYLWHETGEEKYKKAIELLASQFAIQPRTPSGTYWHKQIYPNQVWLDGLFMGEPFAAQYAKEMNHPEKFDDIVLQFVNAERLTYEPRCGLYAHACDESKEIFWADPNTGRSLNVWGRSVGWFCMALLDALDFFPADHSGRETLINLFRKVIGNVVKYQDEKGVWYQVMDNRRSDNYRESTCTCMFAYALEKGIRLGYISEEEYGEYRDNAVDGIISEFIKEIDTTAYITQGCSVAGLGPADNTRRDGTLDYYMSEPVRDNDFKGVGPFLILAASY
ncbi:MAG: glycoside hydrolase family 88 protein [Clostridia bacterium]|nr:glycoside hydrolase family 88 protein [Clostridia bacterium]